MPETFKLQLQVAEILTHTATPITMVENTTPAVKLVKASKVAIMSPDGKNVQFNSGPWGGGGGGVNFDGYYISGESVLTPVIM